MKKLLLGNMYFLQVFTEVLKLEKKQLKQIGKPIDLCIYCLYNIT